MRFEELSQEDQMLLKTQFPEELEKAAAAEIQVAQECYSVGFEKFAGEIAENLEKLANEGEEEEEEKEHEKKLTEEQKKEASAKGAFIFQGTLDGLKKLGQENYGDELAYLYPFIQEKMAGLESVVRAGKELAGKAYRGTGVPQIMAGKKMEALGKSVAAKGNKAGNEALMARGAHGVATGRTTKAEGLSKLKGLGVKGGLLAGGIAAGRASKDDKQ